MSARPYCNMSNMNVCILLTLVVSRRSTPGIEISTNRANLCFVSGELLFCILSGTELKKPFEF